jgi:hypothetical protein
VWSVNIENFAHPIIVNQWRAQDIVARLLFIRLCYFDASQNKTLLLNAILITLKFDLRKFAFLSQYHKLIIIAGT